MIDLHRIISNDLFKVFEKLLHKICWFIFKIIIHYILVNNVWMLQLFHMGWLSTVNFRYFDFQTAHQSGYFDFLKPQLAGQGCRSAFEYRRKICSDQVILLWHAGHKSVAHSSSVATIVNIK